MTITVSPEQLGGVESSPSRDGSLFVFYEHKFDNRFGRLKKAGEFAGEFNEFGVICLDDGTANVAIPAGKAVEILDICHYKDGELVREQLERSVENPAVFVGNISLKPGDSYGLISWGENSHIDHTKLAVDPFTRAINGDISHENGAVQVPMCVAVDRKPYEWQGLDKPVQQYQQGQEVVYECHPRAATLHMPGIEASDRGTIKALGEKTFIDHISELGVTILELMPVQHYVANEKFLYERNCDKQDGEITLENAWGYNTLGFFAVHGAYTATNEAAKQNDEFRDTVAKLHAAGVKVVMDVVYNHTAETGDSREHLTFGALDIDAYIHHDNHSYTNYTGCGPDMDASKPFTQEFILDSLEYWVKEMGVDGFRFDLFSTLLREGDRGERVAVNGSFATALLERKRKLEAELGKEIMIILEGWDLGHCSPQDVSEIGHAWNNEGKHTIRDFGLGIADINRISALLSGRIQPLRDVENSPINYVDSHDGFTLEDVVSYNQKHNEQNRGNSGDDHNRSYNHGIEGATDDQLVLTRRLRTKRAMIDLLFLSDGIPMIVYGDEESRTQDGNNDPYCQKELIATSWKELLPHEKDFKNYLIHRIRQRKRFAAGSDHNTKITWLNGDGGYMGDDDWKHHTLLTVHRLNEETGQNIMAVISTANGDLPSRMPQAENVAGEYELLSDSHTGLIREATPLKIKRTMRKINGRDIAVLEAERQTFGPDDVVSIAKRSVKTFRQISSDVRARYGTHAAQSLLGKHVSEILAAESVDIAA